MMTNFELLFWLAAGVIAYTYVGYPLLMWLWSRLRKPHRKLAIEPRVSVVLTAREAGSDLHAGIENLLDLDYPQNRREIVVACGGTEAEATALARTFARRGVRVERWPAGQGRAALLNDLVPRLHGDVVVLVDAGHRIEPDAVHAMVRHFADPRTGAVSGHLVHDGGRTGVGEVYENFLRDCEGRVHSSVCTSAALFALRRRLFTPLPDDTIIEDALVARDLWRRGYRVHYEPAARIRETGGAGLLARVRSPRHALQLLWRACGCWNPSSNPLWLQAFSHRFLRLLGPLCLVTAFVTNFALLDQPQYRLLFALQVVFYGVALAGACAPERRGPLFNVPCAICQLNWNLLKGMARVLFGRQEARWEKVEER